MLLDRRLVLNGSQRIELWVEECFCWGLRTARDHAFFLKEYQEAQPHFGLLVLMLQFLNSSSLENNASLGWFSNFLAVLQDSCGCGQRSSFQLPFTKGLVVSLTAAQITERAPRTICGGVATVTCEMKVAGLEFVWNRRLHVTKLEIMIINPLNLAKTRM